MVLTAAVLSNSGIDMARKYAFDKMKVTKDSLPASLRERIGDGSKREKPEAAKSQPNSGAGGPKLKKLKV